MKRLEKEEAVEEKKIAEIEDINGNLNALMRLKERELHNFREQLDKEKQKYQTQAREIENLKDKIQDLVSKKLEEETLRDRISEALAQLESELNS